MDKIAEAKEKFAKLIEEQLVRVEKKTKLLSVLLVVTELGLL